MERIYLTAHVLNIKRKKRKITRNRNRFKLAINKSDIVNQLKKSYPNFLRRDLEKLISIVLNEIKRALKRGDSCEIRGFGRFSTRNKKARISRNPKTGEKVNTPAKKVVAWKMGKEMFNKINNQNE